MPWSCYKQALLALRWFRDATRVTALARDAGIGLATAYRHLHEVIVVLTEQTPDLPEVLAEALRRGLDHVLLDGTLIPSDRVNEPHRRSDRWSSDKHHRHGGNVQVLCTPDGTPIWTSPRRARLNPRPHNCPPPRPARAVPGRSQGAYPSSPTRVTPTAVPASTCRYAAPAAPKFSTPPPEAGTPTPTAPAPPSSKASPY